MRSGLSSNDLYFKQAEGGIRHALSFLSGMQTDPVPQAPENRVRPCPAYVLLVDDNEDATFLLRRLLKKAGIDGPIESVSDGEAAVIFLAERMEPNGCLPVFVALDLKMPIRDGFDVLRWVRSKAELEDLVVIIVSSSDEERDVKKAFELGADCFLVKHPDPAVLSHIYAVAIEIKSRQKKRVASHSDLRKDCLSQRRPRR